MRRCLYPTVLAVLALCLVLSGGCARDTVGPGTTTQTATPGASGPEMLRIPPTPAAPLAWSMETKRIAADKGGKLSVGTIEVKIQPHSLPADTEITLALAGDGSLGFRLQPDGLVLLRPAQVKIEHLEKTNHRESGSAVLFRVAGTALEPRESRVTGRKVFSDLEVLGDYALGSTSEGAGDIEFIKYLNGPGYEMKLVEADKGGVVTFDRFKVTIPKGALAEDTYITVGTPGNGYLMCDLEPHGTRFLVPVGLEMDVKGLDLGLFTDWTIFWLDDAGLWEDQGARFDKDRIRVELHHFSRYAGGRAGW